jgi:hypothetical protein
MKTLGLVIVFAFLGSMLGLMIGVGESSQTKKGIRNTTMPLLSIIGIVAGAIGGIVVGVRISEDDKQDKLYGFDSMQTFEGKNGRKWFMETRWNNPSTTNQNVIKTDYSAPHNTVITYLNDKPIINHNDSSGAKTFISKIHMESVGQIKNQIKDKTLELI